LTAKTNKFDSNGSMVHALATVATIFDWLHKGRYLLGTRY
jgi:hypothetical protein